MEVARNGRNEENGNEKNVDTNTFYNAPSTKNWHEYMYIDKDKDTSVKRRVGQEAG